MLSEEAVRPRSSAAPKLSGDVLVTARSGEDVARTPLDRARQRLVSRRVARVEGEDDIDVVGFSLRDRAGDKAHPLVPTEFTREFGVADPLVLPHIDAYHLEVDPLLGEVVVGREREIGVPAAQIHRSQGLSLMLRYRNGFRDRPYERVDLTALRGVCAEHGEQRVTGVDDVRLVAVVSQHRLGLGSSPMHLGVAPLSDPDLEHGRGRLQTPVGERLREERVHRRGRLVAPPDVAGVWEHSIRSDDLQSRTDLDHNRAELGPHH